MAASRGQLVEAIEVERAPAAARHRDEVHQALVEPAHRENAGEGGIEGIVGELFSPE